MAEAEKKLGDEDMRKLAARLRATTYKCHGDDKTDYHLHCEELESKPPGDVFLKVVGNGVECVIWREDNKIYANDELPPIEGVEIIPFTETDRNKNRHFVLNV